jgi:protein SCO1
MRNLRIALWAAVAVAAIVFFALLSGVIGPRAANSPAMQAGAPLGGAFTLTDEEGQPITEAVLRGQPSVLFFGFTHCPDVCPTTLSDMTSWIDELGADADRMRFVFVTVDPERDTPEILRDYLSAFSERIVGITGEPEKVQAMVRDHKIVSRKVPLEDGGYTMDHTASVLLLDPAGSFVGTIARDESREAALAKLRRLATG